MHQGNSCDFEKCYLHFVHSYESTSAQFDDFKFIFLFVNFLEGLFYCYEYYYEMYCK